MANQEPRPQQPTPRPQPAPQPPTSIFSPTTRPGSGSLPVWERVERNNK
jgi:hypothetical protein